MERLCWWTTIVNDHSGSARVAYTKKKGIGMYEIYPDVG